MNASRRFASILALILAAHLIPALPAQAQSLSDLLGKSNSSNPGGLGDILGQVKTLAGSQSADDEARSGEAIAATVFGAAPLWRKPAAQSYVNLVGRNLARQVERKGIRWRFAILDTPSINAMAFPGGIVVITRGLYAHLTSEDELAAVLAHEIAHVNRRHQWKVIQQQKLVALAGDAVTRSDPGRSALVAADLGTRLMARGLDKSAEFEADRDGVVIAARAGYDSSSLIAVMERLQALKTGAADTALLFSTHPSPEARIAALTSAATPEIESAAELSAAALRIRAAH